MNQIKFRAWDGKEMIVPTAVINGKAAILKRCNDNREMTDDEGVHYYCNWDMDVVTDYPLMQFTGLQDKNCVDIYEGDICLPLYNRLHKFAVIYKNGKYNISNFCHTECKVIGNIHQNPELNK